MSSQNPGTSSNSIICHGTGIQEQLANRNLAGNSGKSLSWS